MASVLTQRGWGIRLSCCLACVGCACASSAYAQSNEVSATDVQAPESRVVDVIDSERKEASESLVAIEKLRRYLHDAMFGADDVPASVDAYEEDAHDDNAMIFVTRQDEEDPFASFDDSEFVFEKDAYTLDTVYFATKEVEFKQFDLNDARSTVGISTQSAREYGAKTLDEVITRTTPWSPLPSTGSSPGPLLVDGLNGAWVRVLIDGIPYTRTNTGRQGTYPDLGNIPVDPQRIERVDIYRGSGPSGTCGTSGVVINLITKDPVQKYSGSIKVDGGVGAQGVSNYGARAILNIPIGSSWALRLNGGWNRDQEIDVTGDDVFDRPRRTLDDAEVQALWRPDGEDRLNLVLRTFGTQQYNIANIRDEIEDRTVSRGYAFDAKYRNAEDNDDHLTLRVSGQYLDHLFYKYVRRSGFHKPMAQTDAYTVRGTLTWEREFDDHLVSAELCSTLDIVHRYGDAGDTPVILEPQMCVGVRDTWQVHDKLKLEASALGGYHQGLGPRWSGGLAANVRLAKHHSLRVSFDAGQRIPSVEERYIDFDHSALGYVLVGNEDLGAEQSFSGRAGWVFLSDDQRIGAEMTAFVTLLRNRIEPYTMRPPSRGEPSQFSYQNAGRGLSGGVDSTFRVRDIGDWFGFDTTYNFIPVAEDPDTHSPLSMQTHHSLRASVRGDWFQRRLSLWTTAGVRSKMLWSDTSGDASATDGSAPPQRPSFLWDVGISGSPHSSLWLNLTAHNLVNDVDPNWGPMPGFEVLLSAQWSFERSR